MSMRYDVIIVGGGAVGVSLALALRPSALRVALIEAHLPRNNDARLFALNHSSCQFLKNLGVWPTLASHATPIHHVHVSYQGHFGAARLHREDLRLPDLGHVIPARHLETALNEALTSSSITRYRPARLTQLAQQASDVHLTLETAEGEKHLSAPIVIGADGADSTVRTQLGIATTIADEGQSALVTRTHLQRSHDHIAYERFQTNGVMALLPLAEQACATIWTADHATIAEVMRLSSDDFLNRLQKEFGYRLGRFKKTSERFVYPLRSMHAETMVNRGVMLLGNAAHHLSPVAAQGLNLSFYEVATLTEHMITHVVQQGSLLGFDLYRVSEAMQAQQATSIGVSHRLSQLFSKKSWMMRLLLQAGLVGFDMVTPMKKKFMTGMIGSINERI